MSAIYLCKRMLAMADRIEDAADICARAAAGEIPADDAVAQIMERLA